jgi:hypothetical protein
MRSRAERDFSILVDELEGATMKLPVAAFATLLFAAASTAELQAEEHLFLNPFLGAEDYLLLRGDASEAALTLRYELTKTVAGEAEPPVQFVLSLAGDWALVRLGERVSLLDYRLNRRFEVDEQSSSFVSTNLADSVVVRVFERLNRESIRRIVDVAGGNDKVPDDACDSSTELGIVLPALTTDRTDRVLDDGSLEPVENATTPIVHEIAIRHEGQSIIAACNDRDVGRFDPSDITDLPSSFWPTLISSLPVHPALFGEALKLGHGPQLLQSNYRTLGHDVTIALRLTGSDERTIPYPLTPAYRNTTQAWLAAKLTEPTAALAYAAVAGMAGGGAPKLEEWDDKLRELAADGTGTKASMAVLVTFSMFPELIKACRSGAAFAACEAAQGLRKAESLDPAVSGLITIALGEQRGPPERSLDGMRLATRSRSNGDHPALKAAFALALMRYPPPFQEKAKQLGLPTDPGELIRAALSAYPYNPAYWTDLGDLYLAQWDITTGLVLFDIAMSLPIPGAAPGHPVLDSKRAMVSEIRADFPDYAVPVNRKLSKN